jgi:hypothetical protein
MAETIEFKIHAKVDAVEKDLKSVRESVNNTEKSVNDLSQSFEKGGKSVKGIGKAMSGLGNVLKTGLGVGIVVKLFDALSEAFQNNQQVADLLAKAGVTLAGMINGLVKVATPAIETLSRLFTDPKQAWEDFKDTLQAGADWLKDQFVDRVVDSFKEFGLGFESIINSVRQKWNSLTGDDGELAELNKRQKEIEKEQDDINKRQEERNDRFMATVDKVKNGIVSAYNTIADSTKKAFDNADLLANAEYNINRLAALYTGIVEQYDRMAEQQRQFRDDDKLTIEERIKANEELGRVLDEGEQKEKENLQARIGILQQQQSLLGFSRDRQLEILALTQEITGVEAKYEGLRSEYKTNINSLERESIDLKRALAEGTIEANKIISESDADLEKDQRVAFEKRKQNLLDEYEARKALSDEIIALEKEGTQAYVDAVNERKILDAQYAADTKALAKEVADYDVDQAKKTAEAKMATLEAVSSSLGSIAQLVGENSAFGKAVAVSQAIIDTYAGASKALAQGGIIGPVAAAGVIAAGLANVRAIMQTDVPEPPGGGGGGYAADIPALMPSVGIVGQQVNPNAQIAGSLNRNLGQPQRAYVIGQDVTTQTSLDRAIRKNATLGG